MSMVEWRKMWEVTTWDKKFNGVEKSMQPKVIKYHYYLANELNELERQDGDIRILYTTDKIAYADSTEVRDYISEGEIVAIPWGGNVSIKYFNGKFITADNRIATSNNRNYLNNKFLFYWMLTQKDLIGSFYRGAGIKHPSMLSVLNIQIPIPSLSEQNRIVGILDTFTASIDNLKQQIEQRRKQYEYYRDQLLNLEGKEGVEMKTLGEVSIKIFSGKNKTKLAFGKYPVFGSTGIIAYTDSFVFCKKMILVARVGANAGFVHMAHGEYDVTDNTLIVDLKNSVSQKYIYQYMRKANINQFAKGGGQPLITASLLKQIEIPVPSLSEQQRIVSILDTFEASIANLEQQLAQRQKQYEYYRNKLLTFD